ncbi:carboxylesterase/lipase family protein [Novosphingobium aquae]|uniref:Carboxylic ester hydrolase n=1 Tax=Novosphingobium aquae TaxID=3133435 RepID=A0ABU8SC59_9SPHN
MADIHTPPSGPTVRTAYGNLAGEVAGGIVRYLGIPYAAPPVRFAMPTAPASWPELRRANEPGDCAPQVIKDFPGLDVVPLVGKGGIGGRDYLKLNVWAPVAAGPHPVMVFIHGGGFVIGSKDAPIQDGSAFTASGVVCVSMNYRLGIDGFLPVPGAPTNLGLHDILFALHWVQDNIAAFGGDPANVTLFGESAGAMATADLVTSPLARGLFRRAIIQSGHGAMVRDIGVAQRLVRKLAKILRVAPDAAGFAGMTDEAAMQAIEAVSKPTARIDLRDAEGREPVFGISRFIPVHGDEVLPLPPLEALKRGAGKDIDVLIGSNADEMNLYFVPTGVRAKLKGFIGKLMARWIIGKSHPDAGAVLAAYGLGRKGVSVGDAFTRALTDLVFRWPARQYAAAHQGKCWMYELDWRSPACGGELGACHGMELPFVFKTLPLATGAAGLAGENPPAELAERVHALWVGFARDGSLPWRPYDVTTRQVFQLDRGEAISEPVMPAAAHLPE